MKQVVTKEQIVKKIEKIESKWWKTSEDYAELRRLRQHLYLKEKTEVLLTR